MFDITFSTLTAKVAFRNSEKHWNAIVPLLQPQSSKEHNLQGWKRYQMTGSFMLATKSYKSKGQHNCFVNI
jgi:hypothetical protein